MGASTGNASAKSSVWAVPLIVLLTSACGETGGIGPEHDHAEAENEPFVIVRRDVADGEINEGTAFDPVSGGGYVCDDPQDCWDRCPPPTQDGGTTVCRCTRYGDGPFACTVVFYGPDDDIPGLGGGGSGCGSGEAGGGGVALDCPPDPCTADQKAIAAEYDDPRRVAVRQVRGQACGWERDPRA